MSERERPARDRADRRLLADLLLTSPTRAGLPRLGLTFCAAVACLVLTVAVGLFPFARREFAKGGAAAHPPAGAAAPAGTPASPGGGTPGGRALPAVTYANRQLAGPGGSCCWTSSGHWKTMPRGGPPDFSRSAAVTTDPTAWFEWSLGEPDGGRRWDRLKVRVWIPDSGANAWVRYSVTARQGDVTDVRSFDVAQQDYEGWYELPATFSIGTPDQRTGSASVRVTYLRAYDGGAAGEPCTGGPCTSMAASQVEFGWS